MNPDSYMIIGKAYMFHGFIPSNAWFTDIF